MEKFVSRQEQHLERDIDRRSLDVVKKGTETGNDEQKYQYSNAIPVWSDWELPQSPSKLNLWWWQEDDYPKAARPRPLELNQESAPDAAILIPVRLYPPKTNRELNIAGFFGDRAARLNPLDVLLAENRGDNDFYRSRADPGPGFASVGKNDR